MEHKPIAELIDDLFTLHRKSDGEEFTNQEVAKEVGCDASYIGKLRRGLIKNPGRDVLIGLAKVFEVPITYFFPEMESESVDPDTQVSVALRSLGLDNESTGKIRAIIDLIRGKR